MGASRARWPKRAANLADDRDAALALLAATKDRRDRTATPGGGRARRSTSRNAGIATRSARAWPIVASLIRDLGALSAGVSDGLANADLED